MASTSENEHGTEGEVLDYESDNERQSQRRMNESNNGDENNIYRSGSEMAAGFGIYIRNIDHKVFTITISLSANVNPIYVA
ncbi:hypothetical protein EON65_20925 [archaeon]|nr:MAG: hypothetical protein EON65_20925 [archaeon]